MGLSSIRIPGGLGRVAGITCLVLFAAFVFFDVAIQPKALQWDFASCYYAGEAVRRGADPYDTGVLSARWGKHLDAYGYNPLTLPPFMLLSRLDYPVAARVFLFFKVLALAALLAIWKGVFLKGEAGLDFYVVCLLGYNTTIFTDLRSGNIALFEQLFIWGALWAFLRRRLAVFCGLILLAALIKGQPLFFLFLLAFCDDKKKFAYLAGAVLAFVALNAVAMGTLPHLFAGHLQNAFQSLREGGIANPSTLNLAREAARLTSAHLSAQALWTGAFIGYILITCAVLFFSLRAVPRIRTLGPEERRRWLVYLACFVFALACPRFKSYSYILLLAPTYAVIRRMDFLKAAPWLVLLVVMPTMDVRLPFYDIAAHLATDYYPLLVAAGAWIMCLIALRRPAPQTK